MKLTLQVQLLPNKAQADSLRQTLERFNESTNWLSGCAFAEQLYNKYALQEKHYRELRTRFGLSSQMAVRAIAQVAEAYKSTERPSAQVPERPSARVQPSGHRREKASTSGHRREKSEHKAVQPHFRRHAAMPYDARILSFKPNDRVSLLTLDGRVVLPFRMGEHQRLRFDAPKGQCDLVLRDDGKWFLLANDNNPTATVEPETITDRPAWVIVSTSAFSTSLPSRSSSRKRRKIISNE